MRRYVRYYCYKLYRKSTSIASDNRSRISAHTSLSSQMQIFQGLSTCVKPTLTRPQSSKAECLILRHRRHAAIRCTAELTVRLLLHLHSRPIASLAAFLRPIVRQSSALGHANTSLPSSRRRRRRHGCMDACLSSAMDIPSWSLPCLL